MPSTRTPPQRARERRAARLAAAVTGATRQRTAWTTRESVDRARADARRSMTHLAPGEPRGGEFHEARTHVRGTRDRRTARGPGRGSRDGGGGGCEEGRARRDAGEE